MGRGGKKYYLREPENGKGTCQKRVKESGKNTRGVMR